MVDRDLILSVVAVSRNDNHGGDMLGRMQHFVNGFIAQCNRHNLPAELIMVEWNPPADRPALAEALSWPEDLGLAEVRIVTVPRELHSTLDHSDALPLYQMIGKNVGIRRARAPYVLATNVDILFNDALFKYMRDQLKPGIVLRVDRFDVPPDVPHDVSFDEVISFCDRSFYHVGTRLGMFDAKTGELLGIGDTLVGKVWAANYRSRLSAASEVKQERSFYESLKNWSRILGTAMLKTAWRIYTRLKRPWPLRRAHFGSAIRILASIPNRMHHWVSQKTARLKMSKMHTFACGDFTLVARDDWFRLRGYAEWPMYSWHIDSVFMHAARAVGIRQVALGPEYRIYHVEQTAGSGWSPQASDKLFARLDAAGIPYLSDEKLKDLALEFLVDKSLTVLNDEDWGFASHDLPTTKIVAGGAVVRETEAVSG